MDGRTDVDMENVNWRSFATHRYKNAKRKMYVTCMGNQEMYIKFWSERLYAIWLQWDKYPVLNLRLGVHQSISMAEFSMQARVL
jgi:hypothetical protein